MKRPTAPANGPTMRRTAGRASLAALVGLLAVSLVACGDDEDDLDLDDTSVPVATDVGQTPSGTVTSVPMETQGTTAGSTGGTSAGDSTEPTPVRGSVSNDAGGGGGTP